MARLPVWPPAVLRIKSIQVYHHVTYTMFQCANICNAHGPATRRKGRDADFARPRLFARAQRGVSRVPVAGPQVLLGRTAPAGRTQVVVGLLWLCIRSLFSPMRTWCGRRNRTHISLCRCRHPIWQTHTYTHTHKLNPSPPPAHTLALPIWEHRRERVCCLLVLNLVTSIHALAASTTNSSGTAYQFSPKMPKEGARYSGSYIRRGLSASFTHEPVLSSSPLLSRSEKTLFAQQRGVGGRAAAALETLLAVAVIDQLCCRRRCSLPPPHPRISCYHKPVHKLRAMRSNEAPPHPWDVVT